MELFDTHCHIHFSDYALDAEEVLNSAYSNGVTRLICVGCTLEDSKLAVEFASQNKNVWASVGFHPHEANRYVNDQESLERLRILAEKKEVVAIGEIGLDYYYGHSSRENQQKLLRLQLDIAIDLDLPVIFHVRDAFEDFWKIFDEYEGLRGVVHSFTATAKELNRLLARGLFVGLNGIMTFTKDKSQLEVAREIPLNNLILETDAPFLTPAPLRGKVCEPGHVVLTAKFLSELREQPLEELAAQTTRNALDLFRIL